MDQAIKEELLDLYFKFHLKVGPTDLQLPVSSAYPLRRANALDGIAAEACKLSWWM
jgi:hypothetical protein